MVNPSSSSPSIAAREAPAAPQTPLEAARLIPEAFRLLRAHRPLWTLALVPAALSVFFLTLAVSGIVANAGMMMDWVGSWLPAFEAGAWYTWLWIGPLQLAMALARYLLFALLAGMVLLASWLLAGLAAAPFLDVLSARVERIQMGRVHELPGSEGLVGIVRDGGRAFRGELQRVAFFGAVWLVVSVAGFVIPGGQLIAAPVLTAITVFFLPIEYAGFALDRRGLGFAEKRAWLRGHGSVTTGFGIAAFVGCLVPGLNLGMIPVLVAAGTLLCLRLPPADSNAELQGRARVDSEPGRSASGGDPERLG